MSGWEPLLRLRQGELAPVQTTVWRDGDGDLLLFMDEGDGSKVIGIPLSAQDRQALAEVLTTGQPW